MSEIDFDGINQAAARDYRSLLSNLIPGGKFRGKEYVAKNPRRNDQHPGSFSINFKTGVWKDFSSGDGGNDLISLVAFIHGIGQGEAARELAEKLGVQPYKTNGAGLSKTNGSTSKTAPQAELHTNCAEDNEIVIPVPVNAPPAPAEHFELGKPTKTWTYTDATGATIGYVYRFDPPERKKKEFRPLSLHRKKGELEWRWECWPTKCPLYGLHKLAERPFAKVYVAEGEKSADAAQKLLPDCVIVTSPNGCNAAHKADWSPLRGRDIVIWPDADGPGEKYKSDVIDCLIAIGVKSVATITSPVGVKEGWDAADALEEGWTTELVAELVAHAVAAPSLAQDGCHQGRPAVAVESAYEEIRRLASLAILEYEFERIKVAESLGMRASVLDQLVTSARPSTENTKGQERPLELPNIEPWHEPVNGADLLDDICNAAKRYLVLPEGCAEVLALWAIHTHALECFEHSPRLAITSPEKQCGKTLTLDVLGELVGRPLPTSNATTAAIFRTIEIAKPTLLIDEADTFLGENEELRGVLNSGHRRGGHILRTVGDDHEPRQFATWAPAAIAMIGRLPDTLEDRSVSIALRRRRPTEKVQQFRSDRVQHLRQLSRKIARWCADNRQSLAASDPKTGALANRAADNWRPLLSIADLAGGPWPEHARAVAEAAETTKQDQSKRTMVLSDIRDIFAARPGIERLRSAEMAEVLGAMENRPWPEWRNGRPMTPAALARLLAPFGITPGTKRDGEATFKGYLLSDFREAFATYLPDQTVTPSQPNNDGRCDGLQSVTPENDVTVSKCNKPNNDGHCDGVTVPTPRSPDSEWIDL